MTSPSRRLVSRERTIETGAFRLLCRGARDHTGPVTRDCCAGTPMIDLGLRPADGLERAWRPSLVPAAGDPARG